MGADKLPYSTLSYANGMGFFNTYDITGARQNMTNTNFTDPYLLYMTSVGRSEVHGGEDVGVYSIGPWSHLFSGNYEQNNIPVAMAYAAQIGPYASETRTCSSAPKTQLLLFSALAFMAGVVALRSIYFKDY